MPAFLPLLGTGFGRGFIFRSFGGFGGGGGGLGIRFRSSGVRGGQRLARFLHDLRELTPEEMAKIMTPIVEDVVLPELRSRTPERTGVLRKSLRVVRRKQHVQIRGAFYGRFTPATGSPQTTVAELAMDIIQSRRLEIKVRLIAAVKARLGI